VTAPPIDQSTACWSFFQSARPKQKVAQTELVRKKRDIRQSSEWSQFRQALFG